MSMRFTYLDSKIEEMFSDLGTVVTWLYFFIQILFLYII